MMPPTWFNLNTFTAPFQLITDTYGIPNYKEVNPTYFGMITFPMEFGVMFGDVGHGFMVLLISILLIIFPEKVTKMGLGGFVKV
jgi:V-type H+-transporting ATPase subunit a